MKGYIHEHLNFDEIIDEDTQNFEYFPKIKQRDQVLKVANKQGKPFWLQKDQFAWQQERKKKLQALKKQAMQRDKQQEDANLYHDYESDFQQFTESFHESIAKQSRKQSSLMDYHQINMSAQLPTNKKIKVQINKISSKRYQTNLDKKKIKLNVKVGDNSRSKTLNNKLSLPQNGKLISKSAIELKKDNRDLLQKINYLKQLIPQYDKNLKMLQIQKSQMKKFKQYQKRIFDADYEHQLNKAVQKSQALQNRLKKVLQQKQRKIKKNDHRLVNRNIKVSPVVQQQVLDKVYIVREELMCKMRQDICNGQKILELDKKIMHYKNMLENLNKKLILDSYDDLLIKKQKLKSQNIGKSAQYSTKSCQLMADITQTNQQISQVQIEIMKTNKQLKIILEGHQQSKFSSRITMAGTQRNINPEESVQHSIPKIASPNKAHRSQRFLKFFKDRK